MAIQKSAVGLKSDRTALRDAMPEPPGGLHSCKWVADLPEDSLPGAIHGPTVEGHWECEVGSALAPQAKTKGALKELEGSVGKVSERFAEAAPLLQSALMRGVGESYKAQKGVAGRGAPASGAGLASLAAAQAGAETQAAGKMADYSIDAAAQDVEKFSYLFGLASGEERKMGQALSQTWDDMKTIDDMYENTENKLGALRDLKSRLEAAGDYASAAVVQKGIDRILEGGELGSALPGETIE